jgi:hypothetical protein
MNCSGDEHVKPELGTSLPEPLLRKLVVFYLEKKRSVYFFRNEDDHTHSKNGNTVWSGILLVPTTVLSQKLS